MNWVIKHKGITLAAFIGLFLFASLAISGVFGSTQLGLTLRTNQDLQRGLVGHWTFDSSDVDGYLVSDSSGNGNAGTIVATSSAQGEVIIDPSVTGTEGRYSNPASRVVWFSQDEAFAVFPDASTDIEFATTSDGGATWDDNGDIGPDDNSTQAALWYEDWTPGDGHGNIIHIAMHNTTDDELLYQTFNPDTSVVTPYLILATGITGSTQDTLSITQARDGTLYIARTDTNDDDYNFRCSSNCNATSSWEAVPEGTAGDNNSSIIWLVPHTLSDNIVMIEQAKSTDTLYYNVFSATSSTWWGSVEIDEDVEDIAPMIEANMGVTFNKETGTIYAAYRGDADDLVTSDHDVRVAAIDAATFATSSLTDVITDTTGIRAVKISTDQNRPNRLYTQYLRTTTISDETTQNLYYKVSEDGGQTWSAEHGPVNDTEQDMSGIGTSIMSKYRISSTWHYDGAPNDNDIAHAEIADLSGYADELQTVGNIGQGMVFDGSDDFVGIEPDINYESAMTWSAWIHPDSLSTMAIMGNYSAFDPTLELTASGGLFFQNALGAWIASSNAGAVRANEWNHVVVQWYAATSSAVSFFVNGEYVPRAQEYGAGIATDTDDFGIGYNWTSYFDGKIDDVRVYNRHLSTSSVERLYQLGATTKIGVTLDTNPDLRNGLVGHWTFDSTDVDGFTVSDRSGSGNDGAIVATSTPPTDEIIDASLIGGADTDQEISGYSQVWTSDDDGFAFYLGNGQDIQMASTTDGGATWNTQEIGNGSYSNVQVWYDKWTPGDEGDLIHIISGDNTTDDIAYATFNTQTYEISSFSIVTTTGDSFGVNEDHTITKAIDGTLYVFLTDSDGEVSGRCSRDCLNGSNWTALPDIISVDSSDDSVIMQPLYGTDNVIMIWWDGNSDESLNYNVYSATSSSWWGSVQIVPNVENPNDEEFGAVMNNKTGEIYLAYADDRDDFVTQDHDIDVWRFDPVALSWTELTNPVVNMSGGLSSTKIFMDENRPENLYVAYLRRTTIGTASTANVYYRISEDGGNTWSAELGPINDAEDELHGISGNPKGTDTIFVSWKRGNGTDDLYGKVLVDIGDYEDEKTTTGVIGQGMKFDGSDDSLFFSGVNFGEGDTAITVSLWSKAGEVAPMSARHDYIESIASSLIFSLNRTTSGVLEFQVCGTGCATAASDNAIQDLEWHHYVGVYDGSTVQVYVDGVASDSSPPAYSSALTSGSTDYTRIGADNSGNSNFTNGQIDDARVYNRALTPSEVQRLYQLGATTKINQTITTNPDLERGLVAHWTFDGKNMELGSTTAEVLDRSSNGNNADMSASNETRPGILGQALRLDGSGSDYPELNTAEGIEMGTGDMTISGWVNIDPNNGASTESFIFNKKNVWTEEGYELYYDPSQNSIRTRICNQSASCTTFDADNRSLYPNTWYMLTTVIDRDAGVSFYLDGQFINTDGVSAFEGEDITNTSDLGSIGGMDGDPPTALFDDIRIYNRTLSNEEITRLYELAK